MSNKKIGALIPIRLASERLPSKAIKNICEKPIVCHLLDQVFASKFLQRKEVVVCTTTDSSDDPLVEIVEKYGASIYRGSIDDIIKRFYDAIVTYNFDAVIQIDGDDILASYEYMDLTMETLLSDSTIDIVTCDGLPLGIATKSFTRNAIEKVYKFYKTEKNDTGFIYYFTRTDLCKNIVLKPASDNHVLDEARLTLDYSEDFDFFRNIIEHIKKDDIPITLEKLLGYLRSNKEIMKTNNYLNEDYFRRTKEKTNLIFEDLEGTIKNIYY